MLLNFNEIKEATVPGMNHGTGTMTAKMYMDEQGKIIPCSIHTGSSIGLHKHETSDEINYVLSGSERQFVTGRKKFLFQELVTSAKQVLSTVISIQVAPTWCCLLLLLKDKFPLNENKWTIGW